MTQTAPSCAISSQALLNQLQTAPLASDEESASAKLASFTEQCRADGLVPLDESPDHQEHLENQDQPFPPKLEALLRGIFGNSPYLTGLITRNPPLLFSCLYADPDQFMISKAAELQAAIEQAQSQDEAMSALRRFKQQAALFIALCDLSECWDLEQVVEAVTLTADTALNQAVNYLFAEAHKKGEVLCNKQDAISQTSGYIVLAMGKHGAFELNYSSDVDLIILYDQDRVRLKDGVMPGPFFVKLTRALIKLMQEYTHEGYVFRMDLRLRPDPGATQIALSTEAAYAYYENFGQNWERAAMIKARPVAGDIEAGEKFLKGLTPYVWRKYLDFAAIDDIHAMKRQIHKVKGHHEIAVKGHNLKLGRGGIREIEFFAQTQQLISGGRHPDLRTRRTLETLKTLAEQNWIKQQAKEELTTAYTFLRRIEHRLQMLNDEQTHTLPDEETALKRIANFSGYVTYEAFETAIKQELEKVQSHYEDLFEDEAALDSACGNLVFVGDSPDPETITTLGNMGYTAPREAVETVRNWHFGRYQATRSPRARQLLTELHPLLIDALAQTPQPDTALKTFDRFLSDLPAGVQLFSLLSSNPNLMRLIADIMGTAPSLAKVVSHRHRVLEALLDPAFFGELPNNDQLQDLIISEFSQCRDYQDTLDRARVIGQEQAFLIGVRLLSGIIRASNAASSYTQLAETVIEELQAKVMEEIASTHGTLKGAGVSILAMGKLGGREMTATSDLDLILIYDFDEGETQSNGAKPLAPSQYFARVTQRLIAALSAPTSEGELYEVDMRLRPSGRAGPVATKLESFISYQKKEAWTWEHMALTRARPITGPKALKQALNEAITETLAAKRDSQELAKAVHEMRLKIEQEKATTNPWNLKQVRGGLVDLEFISQYLQLAHASAHPTCLNTNTELMFEGLKGRNLLPKAALETALEAAHTYNSLIQMIRLCAEKGFTPENASESLKQRLADTLNLPTFSALEDKLRTTQEEVHQLYQDLIEKA